MGKSSKSIFRWINHMQIDLSKAFLLKLSRLFFDRKTADQKLIPSEIHRLLFLRFDDKIGDMIINTSLIREIKLNHPNIKIDVICGRNSFDVIKNNPYLNQIFLFKKGFISSYKLAQRLKPNFYDLVIDFRELTDARTLFILNRINAKINVGIKKEGYKLFNISINEDFRQKHITEKIKSVLNLFRIQNPNLNYDLHLNSEDLKKVNLTLQESRIYFPYIVINPYAAARFRNISLVRVLEIIQFHQNNSSTLTETKPSNVVLIGPPHKHEELQKFIKENKLKNVFCLPTIQTIMETAALISMADLVITPDTSIVHLASAFQRPTMALFREDRQELEQNSVIWAPFCKTYEMIYAAEKQQGEIDMSSFSIEDFKNSYQRIQYGQRSQ